MLAGCATPNQVTRVDESNAVIKHTNEPGYEDVLKIKKPFKGIPSTSINPTNVNFRYISVEEMTRAIDACNVVPKVRHRNRSGWKCLLSLCRFTGCRRSEALRAEWNDVDFEQDIIWIGTRKTQHTLRSRDSLRRVPLHPLLRKLLLERQRDFAGEAGAIVGFSIYTGNLNRCLKSILTTAGLEHWPEPYQNMRRSMVTDAHEAGLIDGDLEKIFGHGIDISRQHYLMRSAERARQKLWNEDEAGKQSVTSGRHAEDASNPSETR